MERSWANRKKIWNSLVFDLLGLKTTVRYFIINRVNFEKNIPLYKWIESFKWSIICILEDLKILSSLYYKKHINKI